MPQFFYKNPLGQREQIFPLVKSSVPNFYICENQKAEQLNIHEGCIETINSEEEISEARKSYVEKNYKHLLCAEVRGGNDHQLSEKNKRIDK